jgi:hypothetical protein
MITTPYVEQDCTFTHEGTPYTFGGAVITPDRIVAYPAADGVLKTWHGDVIGTWRAVASWPVRSWMGSRMYQIEARALGFTYTGRGFGEGMIYRGRRKSGA